MQFDGLSELIAPRFWRCGMNTVASNDPRIQRARVTEELLSSLEEPDDEVAAAFAVELERRSQDVATGRVTAIP